MAPLGEGLCPSPQLQGQGCEKPLPHPSPGIAWQDANGCCQDARGSANLSLNEHFLRSPLSFFFPRADGRVCSVTCLPFSSLLFRSFFPSLHHNPSSSPALLPLNLKVACKGAQ